MVGGFSVKQPIQQLGLLILLNTSEGFKFTDTFFPYTSGEIGTYFVQAGAVMENGDSYSRAIELVRSIIILRDLRGSFDIITGGETRDWIFSNPVAVDLGVPHTMLYKDGKSVGASLKDKAVLHVADLNNEGSSTKNLWIPNIREQGGVCKDIVFFVDRMEKGVKVVEDLGLKSHSVVNMNSSAWDFLRRRNVVSEQAYKNNMDRLLDSDEWARRMLLSEPGIDRLIYFLQDSKTHQKALKVIENYSDIKAELVDRSTHKGYKFDKASLEFIF